MKYKNAAKGIRIIYIAQFVQVFIMAIVLIGDVMEAICSLSDDLANSLTVIIQFVVLFQIVSYISTFLIYAAMVVGMIIAAKDERRFKSAIIWVLSGIAVFIGILAYEIITKESLNDVIIVISNVILMIVTLTVINAGASLAERLGDYGTASYAEKGTVIIAVVYILVIIFDILSMIFINSESYYSTMLIMQMISSMLKFSTNIILLLVLRKENRVLRSQKSKQQPVPVTAE